MAMTTDDWTDILNLAQALMPEPPTATLNRFICDESAEPTAQSLTEAGDSKVAA